MSSHRLLGLQRSVARYTQTYTRTGSQTCALNPAPSCTFYSLDMANSQLQSRRKYHQEKKTKESHRRIDFQSAPQTRAYSSTSHLHNRTREQHGTNESVGVVGKENPFHQLGLPPHLYLKLPHPTPAPIQQSVIPSMIRPYNRERGVVERQEDLIVREVTGCGKTLSFLLPLLANIDNYLPRIQAIIVVPTRELATQLGRVTESVIGGGRKSRRKHPVRLQKVVGEVNPFLLEELYKHDPHLLIATPETLNTLIHRQDADLDLRFVKYVVFDEIDNLLKPRNNPHVTAVMQRLQQLPGRSQTQTRYKEQQQSNGKNTNASNGTGNGNDRASTQSNQSFFEDDRASHLQHQHNTATTTTHYHHQQQQQQQQQQHNQQQERPAIDQSSSNESVVGGSALSEGLQSYLKSIGRDVTTHEHEMDFRTHNQPPSASSSSSSSSFASPIEVLEKEQSMLRSHRQPDSTQALIARFDSDIAEMKSKEREEERERKRTLLRKREEQEEEKRTMLKENRGGRRLTYHPLDHDSDSSEDTGTLGIDSDGDGDKDSEGGHSEVQAEWNALFANETALSDYLDGAGDDADTDADADAGADADTNADYAYAATDGGKHEKAGYDFDISVLDDSRGDGGAVIDGKNNTQMVFVSASMTPVVAEFAETYLSRDYTVKSGYPTTQDSEHLQHRSDKSSGLSDKTPGPGRGRGSSHEISGISSLSASALPPSINHYFLQRNHMQPIRQMCQLCWALIKQARIQTVDKGNAAVTIPHTVLVFINRWQAQEIQSIVQSLKQHPFSLNVGVLSRFSSRTERAHALSGQIDVLLCDDTLSRGIDLKHLVGVVNMGLASNANVYQHRAGRIGRLGGLHSTSQHVVTIVNDRRREKDRLKTFSKTLDFTPSKISLRPGARLHGLVVSKTKKQLKKEKKKKMRQERREEAELREYAHEIRKEQEQEKEQKEQEQQN